MSEDMRTRLTQRRDELRIELARCEERLAQLGKETAAVRETLLRISAAIQVLEEMLGTGTAPPGFPTG